jgi:hypothetical protein
MNLPTEINYGPNRKALMELYLRRTLVRLSSLFSIRKITAKNRLKYLEQTVNCRRFILAAITESYARFIPLLFSPYISSAGSFQPSRVQYLPQSCTVNGRSGFFLPLPLTPSYSITSKYCGL